MLVPLTLLALTASLSPSFVLAVTVSDIPLDIPVSSLRTSADAHLAKGQTNDALVYYDVAISRDPHDYLTYFKRGATYLSLGKSAQATADFDKVLAIKPGFEGALVQRGRIKARGGDWKAARKDFTAHGNSAQDLAELQQAEKAAIAAAAASKNGKWEECVLEAGNAIKVASKMSSLRKTRAHCRFQKGEALEGISDLRHVLQLEPGTIEPHLQVSAVAFYGLSDLEHGIDQLRKCLHSDPDSKKCKTMYRREKSLEKQVTQIQRNLERKQYATAIKALLASTDGEGLVQSVKDDVNSLLTDGTLPTARPNHLVARAVEMTCEAYYSQNNFKKAQPWCDEALQLNSNSLYGHLAKAQRQLQAEQLDAAASTLKAAADAHPDHDAIDEMMQEVQREQMRARNKDYYKVLGLTRGADERQIKAAYRRMVRQHHPDKAHKQGIPKEEAEKKMAAINEAYEVLSDPQLKARFDNGDDPNNHEQHQQPFDGAEWFAPGGAAFHFGGPFGGGASGGNQRFQFSGQEYRFT